MARGRTVLWALAFTLVAGGQVYADKLVVFQNGRTLRVQNVRDEGQWLFLTLGKKSEMGVLARLIANIDEIDGDGPEQLPNVQAAAGGSTQVNRGGTVGNRMVGSQRVPAGQQPPASQEGAGEAADADAARDNALARAAARSTRDGNLRRVPATPGQQEQAEGASNVDLTGADAASGWRSLLDDSRGGQSGRQREDKPRQDDEDPDR